MSTQTFGKYQLIKKLATGGMAEVWLALQTGIEGFNRHVVVKRILPHLAEDPEFVQMFLNEAKIASRFNNPNIAQIYDLGAENGTYYIAMEFIHGEDLGRVMRRAWSSGQWVARHIALRIVADTCSGLYYAHTRVSDTGQPLKVVHRDISPQNILISFDGAVKIVDFGIAKAADQVSNTRSGAIKGKFAYMAPEQAGGKPLDARTDIFALGLILYELMTGVRPLKRDSELATLQAAMECTIELPSAVAEVPLKIDEVVMRALAKSPDDRYRDAREFQKALEQYLVDEKEMATGLQVAELMETLFADRLDEERRLGMPNPSTESSTSNPVASPPPESYKPVAVAQQQRPSPQATIDDDEATLMPELDSDSSAQGRAPEGTVGPSRSYREKKSSSEATRAEVPDEGSRRARRPSSVGSAAVPAPAPRRPTTAGLKVKRTETGSAMPSAPPRKSKLIPAAPAPPPRPRRPDLDDGLSQIVDVRSMRASANSRFRGVVLVAGVLAAAVLGFVFREDLMAVHLPGPLSTGGVPLRLSVTTNPPTTVIIVPPKGAPGRQPMDLGRTPISEQSGAFVGDTIMLINDDRGIRWLEPLDLGEPNALKTIEKTFKETTIKVTTKPKVKAGMIFRNNQKIGQVGVPMAIFPGVQQLEVRSESLTDPVPFEVTIGDGQVTTKEVDVTAAIDKPQPQ
jgi:serine/threonine protein kinase